MKVGHTGVVLSTLFYAIEETRTSNESLNCGHIGANVEIMRCTKPADKIKGGWLFINREALEVVLDSGILYIYTRYGAICHGIVFTINISVIIV